MTAEKIIHYVNLGRAVKCGDDTWDVLPDPKREGKYIIKNNTTGDFDFLFQLQNHSEHLNAHPKHFYISGADDKDEKYARKCSATGVGFNQGHVVNDGSYYFADDDSLVWHLRKEIYCHCEFHYTDQELIEMSYQDAYHYYTEFEECDLWEEKYFLKDGTTVRTEEY